MHQHRIAVGTNIGVDRLTNRSFHPWHDAHSAAVVPNMDVPDAEGKSIRNSSSRNFTRPGNDVITYKSET